MYHQSRNPLVILRFEEIMDQLMSELMSKVPLRKQKMCR